MTDYRKLFDLTGKTAVVLGAASGIGKSSAEALAALGGSVFCADSFAHSALSASPALPGSVLSVAALFASNESPPVEAPSFLIVRWTGFASSAWAVSASPRTAATANVASVFMVMALHDRAR